MSLSRDRTPQRNVSHLYGLQHLEPNISEVGALGSGVVANNMAVPASPARAQENEFGFVAKPYGRVVRLVRLRRKTIQNRHAQTCLDLSKRSAMVKPGFPFGTP